MVVLDVHTLDEHHHQSLTLQSGLELQLRSKLCFENREIQKQQGVEEEKEEVDGSRAPLDRWPGLRSLLARAHSMEELP